MEHIFEAHRVLDLYLLKYVLEVATFSPPFDPFSCFPLRRFFIIWINKLFEDPHSSILVRHHFENKRMDWQWRKMLNMNIEWPFQKIETCIQHSVQFHPTWQGNVRYKCWTHLSQPWSVFLILTLDFCKICWSVIKKRTYFVRLVFSVSIHIVSRIILTFFIFGSFLLFLTTSLKFFPKTKKEKMKYSFFFLFQACHISFSSNFSDR